MKLMIDKKLIINVPKNIKIIICKRNKTKKIILMHEKKFLVFICYNNVSVDKWSNAIVLDKKKINMSVLKLENKLNCFLNSINKYYFIKIKFKGKGFRIKFFKKIKLLKFFFGKSHKTFMFIKKIKKIKINKYKFMIFGINKHKLINLSNIICNIKKLNFYTLRGLKKSRQIVYKRKGKKGTYI